MYIYIFVYVCSNTGDSNTWNRCSITQALAM